MWIFIVILYMYTNMLCKRYFITDMYNTYNKYFTEGKKFCIVLYLSQKGNASFQVKLFQTKPWILLTPSPYIFLRENVKTILLILQVLRINTWKYSLTSTSKARVSRIWQTPRPEGRLTAVSWGINALSHDPSTCPQALSIPLTTQKRHEKGSSQMLTQLELWVIYNKGLPQNCSEKYW